MKFNVFHQIDVNRFDTSMNGIDINVLKNTTVLTKHIKFKTYKIVIFVTWFFFYRANGHTDFYRKKIATDHAGHAARVTSSRGVRCVIQTTSYVSFGKLTDVQRRSLSPFRGLSTDPGKEGRVPGFSTRWRRTRDFHVCQDRPKTGNLPCAVPWSMVGGG